MFCCIKLFNKLFSLMFCFLIAGRTDIACWTAQTLQLFD